MNSNFDDPSVQHALDAITEDTSADWNELDTNASDGSSRDTLNNLRIIARVAHAHAFAPRGVSDVGSAAALQTPCDWGALRAIEPLARGSYGEVYRAWDPRLEREVALKLLDEPEAAVDSLLREGRLLARVRHPNVVAVYGADVIDAHAGIWMELVRGVTLDSIVRSTGPLTADAAAAVGIAVCRALTAVHAAGLIHGDVKAQNVMREEDGRIVVMDFGTGRVVAEVSAGTHLAGTPLYLAPEVLGGASPDARADVYSTGVLLYYVLTSEYPIKGRTLDEVRASHAAGAVIPVQSRRADVPRPLAAVIDRAIAADPSARFESAAALEHALAEIAATPHPSRARRLAAVIGGVAIVALAGIGLWKLRPAGPSVAPDGVVTTSSADALKFYSESYEAGFRYDWPTALVLAREAVASDNTFALGHIWLAWCLRNTAAPTAAVLDEANRAVELSPRAAGWERLWIEASYDVFTNEPDKEIRALTALVKLRPDHFWAVNNLLIRLTLLGREQEALPYVLQRANLRPTEGFYTSVAAQQLMSAGEIDKALDYARRARQIWTHSGYFVGAYRGWTLPIEALWLRGDIRGATAALDAARTEVSQLTSQRTYDLHDEVVLTLIQANLSLGRLRAATEMADVLSIPDERHFNRAVVAFHANDRTLFTSEIRAGLNKTVGGPGARYIYLINAGQVDGAAWDLEKESPRLDPGAVQVDRGLVALAQGDRLTALALLEGARPAVRQTHSIFRFEYLANLYLEQGDRARAIATLHESLAYRSVPFLAWWWMRNELRLAELYHEASRDAEARPLEAELDKLLVAADPDFPLLVRLKALEAKTR